MDLESNLNRVIKRIERAAAKAGRNSSEIKLVAVTKRVEPERVIEALELGIDILHES